jgi:hypothetical protein
MKKAIFAFSFFFALGIAAASAQSCHAAASASTGKSCCASKMASAMAADPTIEKRTADTGIVSYVRKEADAQGNVRFVSVQFDEASSTFVNVNMAPKTMTAGDKAECVKKTASCTASEKKACAGMTSGKACCASKAASTEAAKPSEQ